MGKGCALLLSACLAQASLWAGVRHVPVPRGSVAPDVVADAAGNVYLVYAQDGDAWFTLSPDDGKTFSRPLRLNTVPHQVLAGHERGPKIALGPDGSLHVVWMGAKSDGLFYARRLPAEEHFSAARNLLDARTSVDGPTLAAGPRGVVWVAWLDGRRPADPQNPISLPIFWTESKNNGETFSKDLPAEVGTVGEKPSENRRVQGAALLRACSCCAMRALAGPHGDFYLGFRGAQHNIRDMLLAVFAVRNDDPRIRVSKIHDDHWEFNGCPMSGPSLAIGPLRLWVSWRSRGKVYAAESRDLGRHFGSPFSPRSAGSGPENHPVVLVNESGEVFLAWEEGGEILWQTGDAAGDVRDSGDAGALPANSKAAAFIDRQGNFCLVF